MKHLTMHAGALCLALVSAGCGSETAEGPDPTPTPGIGFSTSNPAPFNTEVHLTFDDLAGRFTARIQPLRMLRGQAAVDRILQDWSTTGDPDPGFEMVTVQIRFHLETAPSGRVYHLFEDISFDAFTAGAESPLCGCLEPRPELGGDVLPGGTLEGWTTLQVHQDDPRPLLTFGRDALGRGGAWWKLYQ